MYGFGSRVVVAKTWPHLHCAAPNPRNGSRYRAEIRGQGSCNIVQKGLYSVGGADGALYVTMQIWKAGTASY